MPDPILVADIGGTNARFALAEFISGDISLSHQKNYSPDSFATIFDALEAYFSSICMRPKTACFAVAGPVHEEEISFTNSKWKFCKTRICELLDFDRFSVINDFVGLASGVRFLKASDFVHVKNGSGLTTAPQLVIGPGTGLGQALIVPTSQKPVIVSTEGGHVAFAPVLPIEEEVVSFIKREHLRVSAEHLLSGQGIETIYLALCNIENSKNHPRLAEEITRAAINKSDPFAIKAVDLFCSILGRVCGNSALATGAHGGVVLGGGILPKIKEVFLGSEFLETFLDQGRMGNYVKNIPVDLIINDQVALLGAASVFE